MNSCLLKIALFTLYTVAVSSCREGASENPKASNSIGQCDPDFPEPRAISASGDSVLLARSGDTIWYITNRVGGFGEDRFFLHLLTDPGEFINEDFDLSSHKVYEVACYGSNFTIFRHVVPGSSGYQLRTGQFIKSGSEWVKLYQLNTKHNIPIRYTKLKVCSKIGPALRELAIQVPFRQALEEGVFFKVRRNTYLLLGEEFSYVINYPEDPGKKFMFHFIRKDRSFINRSFSTDDSGLGECLEYDDLKVKRITNPRGETIEAIRVGLFSDRGNEWTQVLEFSRIKNNPLLKYDGELQKFRTHDK